MAETQVIIYLTKNPIKLKARLAITLLSKIKKDNWELRASIYQDYFKQSFFFRIKTNKKAFRP